MAVSVLLIASAMLSAPPDGTIRLHVTDPAGKPVVGQEVALCETSDDKPLRTFGFFRYEGGYVMPIVFKGFTDVFGDVEFTKARRKVPYSVTAYYGIYEPLTYFGAVRAGETGHVVVRKDCEIRGHVSSSIPGHPASGLKIDLADTMMGHMSGYTPTTIRSTVTDRTGDYRFTGLPPCTFGVDCEGPGGDTPYSLAVRIGTGPWETPGESLCMKHRVEMCDFRLSPRRQ